ncbi:MAG: hypothetical protein HYS12_30050 [Planctomycetes bacterium]|nr:hypothetical protein [Planctomycetota bacterium]
MVTLPACSRKAVWLLPALVLSGLALRSFHYLRVPAVWHDEAALVVNVLDKDFAGLLGPLRWHEAAPPLFLWVERAVVLILGDDILALRLFPFLASCAALLLMASVSRSLLPAAAVPWAVFLFAFADPLAWHACEAKPYSSDVLAAVLLLYVYCAGRHRSLLWQLSVSALLAPLLIFLSYPACFLYGGLLVALLPAVCRQRTTAVCLGYTLLVVAVGASFLLLVLGPARAQHDDTIMIPWRGFFPEWDRPWSVPSWAVVSSLEIVRYCLRPLGQLLLVPALLGAIHFARGGRRGLVVLLVVPVLLALVASCLHRYPYGPARVMVYATPAIVLLIAAGTLAAFTWLRRRARLGVALLVVALVIPGIEALRVVWSPWPRADVPGAAAWIAARRQADDRVLGNDWTHHYYFRDLGPLFQSLEDGPSEDVGQVADLPELLAGQRPAPRRTSGRRWVVFTAQVPAAERLAIARTFAPDRWQVLERRDFRFTTVLLLAPPGDPVRLARANDAARTWKFR